MKEELQGKLLEILTSIQTATGKAADFAMAELPDIAQQYIAYGRVFETVWTVFFFTAMCVFVALVIFLIKKDEHEAAIIPGALFFVSAILFLGSLKDTVMVWFAPKVWLLKEIGNLLK